MSTTTEQNIWNVGNLVAWEVVPWDAKRRTPEQRARMLARLGIRSLAYDWRAEDVPRFRDEIEALKRHNIRLAAWWFPSEPTDPIARELIRLFHETNVQPDLWVMQTVNSDQLAPLPADALPMPANWAIDTAAMTRADRMQVHKQGWQMASRAHSLSFPADDGAEGDLLQREVERVRALVELGREAGCSIQLYSHNGWFGMTDNQVKIIEALAADGIDDVGMIYNFHHSRDEFHDDAQDFPRLWENMRRYVTAVNVNGIAAEGEPILHPSQGTDELAMMRVIQNSGWRGRVGVTAEIGGDVEETLRDAMTGIAWLAAELQAPGSAGPRPRFKTGDAEQGRLDRNNR